MPLQIREEKNIIHMENSHGVFVDILTTGASVYRVGAPDRYGKPANITMTLNSPDSYGKDQSYAGATLGPVSGRIPDGLLEIDGQLISLTQNEGRHHLHGGFQSVSKMEWRIQNIERHPGHVLVSLKTELSDGHEGYPGNRLLKATYMLDEQNQLNLTYTGLTDAPTYFNLSNHCYWNLSGDFSRSALTHILRINAQLVWMNDYEHIPRERRLVRGTPYDFIKPCRIDTVMRENDDALINGYNNLYILDGSPAVTLEEPQSGRRLTVETDYPALQFYSGGYLEERTVLEGDIPANAGCALAFEPQEMPILQRVPSTMARPDFPWKRNIRYTFDNC